MCSLIKQLFVSSPESIFLPYSQTSDSDYSHLARDQLVEWVRVYPAIIQSSPFFASAHQLLDHAFSTDNTEISSDLRKVNNLIQLIIELLHCNAPITSFEQLVAAVQRLHIRVCQRKAEGSNTDVLTELEGSLSSLEKQFQLHQPSIAQMKTEDRIIPNPTFFY